MVSIPRIYLFIFNYLEITFQDRMESNSQRLYPQLDSPSPPPPPEEQRETLSMFPLSHFTPPPPPPAGYFQTNPIHMPQMEQNPLYNPDSVPPSLRTELLLTSPIPPLVMNSLTQQIILAQQQALNQHFSTNVPMSQQVTMFIYNNLTTDTNDLTCAKFKLLFTHNNSITSYIKIICPPNCYRAILRLIIFNYRMPDVCTGCQDIRFYNRSLLHLWPKKFPPTVYSILPFVYLYRLFV